MTALSDYLTGKAREQGLSINAFARRVDLAVETARRLLYGEGQPTEQTLRKVAEKLPAPLRKLRELAGAPAGEAGPFQAPPEFDRLDRDERDVVIAVGRRILRSRGVTDTLNGSTVTSEAVDAPGGTVTALPLPERVTRAAKRRPKDTEKA